MNTDDLSPHQLAQVLEEVLRSTSMSVPGFRDNLHTRIKELRASAAGAGKGEEPTPQAQVTGNKYVCARHGWQQGRDFCMICQAEEAAQPAADRSQDERDEEGFRLWAKRVGYADLDEAEWARNGWYAALRYSRQAQP